MDTDIEWEEWGRRDPYFGVITHQKFRKPNLTPEAKEEFFESGRRHVEHVLQVCRAHIDQGFSPKRVLDFGCGVGRLVVPFCEVAEHVVGLDVSESMLVEARKNCAAYAAANVSLLRSEDDLSILHGTFDLIHSFIVFQHIPTDRGRRIFSKLLGYLEDGGVCAMQLTYAKTIHKNNYGLPPTKRRWRIHDALMRRLSSPVESLRRILKGHPVAAALDSDPEMQMNSYNINEIFFVIQESGVRDMYIEYTDHGGELGVFLYFRKPNSGQCAQRPSGSTPYLQ